MSTVSEIDKPNRHKFTTPKSRSWTIALLSTFAVIAVILGIALYTNIIGTSPNEVIPADQIIPPSQAQALYDLFEATNGRSWDFKKDWLEPGTTPCQWIGIMCADGVVMSIDVAHNNLQGTLPNSLSNLVNLTVLDLRFNSIGGTIPKELGRLQYLNTLRLSYNKLEGTIPDDITAEISELRVLDLSKNRLTGSIMPSITNHSLLVEMYLAHNELTGTIPDMPHLGFKAVDLSYNQLEGTLPKMNFLTESISFENNRLTGPMHSFSMLPFLHTLKVGGNQFSGPLIVSEYQLLSTIKFFNISHNSFSTFVSTFDTNKAPQFTLCDASRIPFQCPLPNWMISRCRATCVEP